MPKAEKLSTKRSAVRARERREKEKEDNKYNATLKEYVEFKYSHIIAEFNPFYEDLKAKRPASMVYTNTNEFRLWRKSQIEKSFSSSNVQIRYFDEQDLYRASGSEQHGEQQQNEQQQQQEQQQSEQPGDDEQQQQQQQQGQQQSEQHDEQPGDDEQQQQQQSEQQQRNELDELDLRVNEIIAELQNGEDEGIALDVYQELQDDIVDFNYHLEVKLEGMGW